MLPFLGEGDLLDKFHLDEPWESALVELRPEVFTCPFVKESKGATNYILSRGKDDLAISEAPRGEIPRTQPGNQLPDKAGKLLGHKGGFMRVAIKAGEPTVDWIPFEEEKARP